MYTPLYILAYECSRGDQSYLRRSAWVRVCELRSRVGVYISLDRSRGARVLFGLYMPSLFRLCENGSALATRRATQYKRHSPCSEGACLGAEAIYNNGVGEACISLSS